MTGTEVKEKLIETVVELLDTGLSAEYEAGNFDRQIQVVPWDGEAELVRPWLRVTVPEFDSFGAGTDAWKVRLSLELATAKGATTEWSSLAECGFWLKTDLAAALQVKNIYISDMDVEDVENVVDTMGRVMALEVQFVLTV
jgi:hypothetical protein